MVDLNSLGKNEFLERAERTVLPVEGYRLDPQAAWLVYSLNRSWYDRRGGVQWFIENTGNWWVKDV